MAKTKKNSENSAAAVAEKSMAVSVGENAVASTEKSITLLSDENSVSDLSIMKHVALEHLYIIKEYIDAGDKKSGGSGGSVLNTEGVYDLRVYNGKIQYKKDGFWFDVTAVGSDVGSITADEGIHGLRIADGRLQYNNGENWVEVIGSGSSSGLDGCTVAKNSEVEDLFN